MNEQTVEDLNHLLEGELSAVAAYKSAIAKVKDPVINRVLEQNRDSHTQRTNKLRTLIKKLGAVPNENDGAWGSFAKLVANAATSMGEKATIAALEEGEDLGSNEYEWRLLNMHGDHRNIVKEELLPEQQRTHKRLSEITNSYLGGIWPPTPEPKEV